MSLKIKSTRAVVGNKVIKILIDENHLTEIENYIHELEEKNALLISEKNYFEKQYSFIQQEERSQK